jgi:hypothetical protein
MATMGPDDRERFARRDDGTTVQIEPVRQRSIKAVAGGSITEAICGAATVVLAIIGLTGSGGSLVGYTASIATIVFGVALLAQGGAVAARYQQLLRDTMPADWDTRSELGGGMGAEMLGGAAGVVLGVLGLLGLGAAVLIPIAVIVFGGTLLLGSAATADLGALGAPTGNERFAHVTRQAAVAASGTQVLVGVAGVVLGILALVGVETATVALVALLVMGASLVLTGTALSSRMVSAMRH